MKSPESMTYEEMKTEIQQHLERIIAIQRKMSFIPEYQEKATPEECLGLVLSHYFEWSGIPILKVCYEGLTDANFHSEASVIDLLVESENSQALARKIYAENE